MVNAYMAQLRDVELQKNRTLFRNNLKRIGHAMAYELSRTLAYSDKEVRTPLGVKVVPTYDDRVVVGTVLRAGLAFHEGFLDIFDGADLSFLIGVFSGGDSLSPELKKRADKFFREHNASVQIREGYGLTECVTASCVTPVDRAKEGSIGLPLRDMEYRVVEPGTFNEVKRGELGEIIISGPTLMLGYIDAPEENAKTLRTDENGTVWMFSGDMGYMDEEGFIYFKQRIKRLIVTSGYNVYPTHLENILDKHPAVDYSCVIGVKDSYKMQRIRAYIVLKNGEEASDETKKKILEYCKEYLDVFERPKEIIFKDELPKTLVGKVAYRILEEEAEKEAAAQ